MQNWKAYEVGVKKSARNTKLTSHRNQQQQQHQQQATTSTTTTAVNETPKIVAEEKTKASRIDTPQKIPTTAASTTLTTSTVTGTNGMTKTVANERYRVI